MGKVVRTLERNGWTTKATKKTIYAKRGKRGNREELYGSPEVIRYRYGTTAVTLADFSEFMVRATRSPEQAARAFWSWWERRHFGIEPLPRQRALGVRFSYDDPPALIAQALRGRTVTWVNRISGKQESARVNPHAPVTVEMARGRRVVKFHCPETGYRAFMLDSLTAVG